MVKTMYKYHLNDVEWGEFKVGNLFEFIEKGKCSNEAKQTKYSDEGVSYLSATNRNNGVSNFVERTDLVQMGNCIMFVNQGDGGAGYSVYKREDFIATTSTSFGYAKWINKYTGLFVSTILSQLKQKYSFGYGRTENRLLNDRIMLPINEKNNPNWHFMEEYIKERKNKQRNDLKEYYKSRLLDLLVCPEVLTDVDWGEFFLGDIFSINTKPSKGLNHLSKDDKKGIPYVGATNRNNGVLDFVEKDSKLQYDGNCIAFIRNGEGSMGYSIYKRESFIATQDISVGYNENLNEYSAKFITTVADRVRGKYTFGYKRNQARLKKEILTLPVDKEGNPNWTYMENFIKNIEQKQIKNILKYLDEYIYIYI